MKSGRLLALELAAIVASLLTLTAQTPQSPHYEALSDGTFRWRLMLLGGQQMCDRVAEQRSLAPVRLTAFAVSLEKENEYIAMCETKSGTSIRVPYTSTEDAPGASPSARMMRSLEQIVCGRSNGPDLVGVAGTSTTLRIACSRSGGYVEGRAADERSYRFASSKPVDVSAPTPAPRARASRVKNVHQ